MKSRLQWTTKHHHLFAECLPSALQLIFYNTEILESNAIGLYKWRVIPLDKIFSKELTRDNTLAGQTPNIPMV